MPEHLGAAEKIIWLGITQVCVPATTVGGCVLGISLITKTVYKTFSMLSQWGERRLSSQNPLASEDSMCRRM